jgi:branched-subunit amino acid permease
MKLPGTSILDALSVLVTGLCVVIISALYMKLAEKVDKWCGKEIGTQFDRAYSLVIIATMGPMAGYATMLAVSYLDTQFPNQQYGLALICLIFTGALVPTILLRKPES